MQRIFTVIGDSVHMPTRRDMSATVDYQMRAYPAQMFVFVGTAIALLTFIYGTSILRTFYRRKSLLEALRGGHAGSDPERTGLRHSPVRSLRRTINAFDAAFKIFAFRWKVPFGWSYSMSVSELFFTMGYLAACLIWSFIHSRNAEWYFWINRTGAIATKQMIFLPLLAGKNNVLTVLTGISYEKTIIVHRGAARAQLILVLLHSFGWLPRMTPRILAMLVYWTGVMGTVAFGAIFLFSLRPIRNRAFEFFLYLHILLTPFYLVGIYYHIPSYALYVWLFIAFWMMDRVIRLFRMFWINRGSREGTLEVICRDSVRLVLPNRHMTWKPGQHVFLTLPGVSGLPFESHPMTIANIPERDERGRSKSNELVFYIRALDGFTKKLYDHAMLNPGKTVVALADGPYGCPPDPNTFSTVLLVCGGSGIASILPLLLDVVCHARRDDTPVTRVVLVWAVKDEGDLKWANNELSKACADAPSSLTIHLRVHVTGAEYMVPALPALGDDSMPIPSPVKATETITSLHKSAKDSEDVTQVEASLGYEEQLAPSQVIGTSKIRFGRPDISTILQEEVAASPGPVLVGACGPVSMSNAVRAALRFGAAGPAAMLRGGVPVTMHIEDFDVPRTRA